MQRLYFNHISKTAGTALVSLLEMHLPADLVCPADTIDDLRAIPDERLKEFVLFRGPFANELVHRLPEAPFTATVLRDPIERAISHYQMTGRTPPSPVHPFSALAAKLPLAQAMEHPAFSYMFLNYQARYLTLQMTDEIADWNPPVSSDHPSIYQVRLDFYPFDQSGLEAQSLNALLRYDVIGVAEYLWDAYEQICHLMGWEGRAPLRHRNTGDAQVALSKILEMPPDAFARLLEMNRVDWFLYEVAKHRAKVKAVPTCAV